MARRTHVPAGSSPPTSSTITSTSDVRTDSQSSLQTTPLGTQSTFFRDTLRLYTWVNSSPSGFDSSTMRATELPTVPNPNSAMRSGLGLLDAVEPSPLGAEVFNSDSIRPFVREAGIRDASMIPDGSKLLRIADHSKVHVVSRRDAARSLHSVRLPLRSGTARGRVPRRRIIAARLLPPQWHTPLPDVRRNAGAHDPSRHQHSSIHRAQSLPAIRPARKRRTIASGSRSCAPGGEPLHSATPSCCSLKLARAQHSPPHTRTPRTSGFRPPQLASFSPFSDSSRHSRASAPLPLPAEVIRS
jgi:hypothetical protein